LKPLNRREVTLKALRSTGVQAYRVDNIFPEAIRRLENVKEIFPIAG
jgi:hypothetical protein